MNTFAFNIVAVIMLLVFVISGVRVIYLTTRSAINTQNVQQTNWYKQSNVISQISGVLLTALALVVGLFLVDIGFIWRVILLVIMCVVAGSFLFYLITRRNKVM